MLPGEAYKKPVMRINRTIRITADNPGSKIYLLFAV
jgi:hypothetical protein